MRSKIDWLSFTMTVRPSVNDAEAFYVSIEQAFQDAFGQANFETVFGGAWERLERGRAPYSHGWAKRDEGVTIYASPSLTHMLVEISGVGCTRIIEMGWMESVLHSIADRVTRIDIATDIPTTTLPQEFIAAGYSDRFGSVGVFSSPTGETVYIGSQKSERFARVYRYNPPHPRSDLLRVECVARRDHAKAIARAVLGVGEDGVAAALGEAYGWQHQDWQPSVTGDVDISVVQPERAAGKTVFWMVHSVAPSFKRLVRQGVITDPEGFIRAYFLDTE
jgi:hypothetical protein